MSKYEKQKRTFGLAKDTFSVPDSFFEPLPEDTLLDFGIDPDTRQSQMGSGNYTKERRLLLKDYSIPQISTEIKNKKAKESKL
jgi:hypothetical protein